MIELNGNILLNDTYREQRPPKGILAIVTKNLASLQKFWEKEMDRVRVNPNHMPVMGIESDTGRGSAQYTALLNSVADMDVLNVSERMRESISGLYRISPMYRGSTEGVGGLNAEDIQRAVTAEPVAAAHQGYHEEVFPKLLDMFGITDWKLEFPSPYPANDDAELDKRMKETQIATMMHGMGFNIDLDDETGEFVYSGSSQPAQPGMEGSEEPDDVFHDDLLLGKDLEKARRYIKNPRDAPPGAKVQRGKRGGYFYETTGTPSKKKKPPSEPPKKEPAKIDKEDLTKRMGFYLSGLKFHPEGEKIISEVDEYTGVGYAYLNKYIRDDKIGNDAEADEKIKYISTFLKNAPKMEGTVYRGMGFSKFKEDSTKQFNEFLSNLKEGESLELKPFTSTSVDPNIATKFATKGAAHSITFEIKSKSGVYLDGVSQLEDEGEVLFDKDSKFKIKKVDRSDYPAHVHVVLEEIP